MKIGRTERPYGYDVRIECRNGDFAQSGRDGSYSFERDRALLRQHARNHVLETGHTVEIIVSMVYTIGEIE